MKKLFFLIFLIYWQEAVFAEDDFNKQQARYYANEGIKALEAKDFSFSCELLKHALSFIPEKDAFDAKKATDTVCKAALQQAFNNYENAVTNHPYYKSCPAYKQAMQACASAANYDNCMNIKFGSSHKEVGNSKICTYM